MAEAPTADTSRVAARVSARDRLAEVLGDMYARRHVTTAATAVVRTLGNPRTVRRRGRTATAVGVAVAHAAWLSARPGARNIHDDRTAWVDAAAGATTTLLGATGLTSTTWTRGMAWPSQHTYWCAAGAGMLGTRRSQVPRMLLLAAPHLLPATNRRALGPILPGLLGGLAGASTIGVFLAQRFAASADSIEELVEEVTATEAATVHQRVASEVERSVVRTTVDRLRLLRQLIEDDPPAATELARAEVDRLRRWFDDDRGLEVLDPEPFRATELAIHEDAAGRLERSVQLFHGALRAVVLLAMLTEVRRGRRRFGPARSETAVAALGVAHFALAAACIAAGDTGPTALLAGADVAMNLVNSALEPGAANGTGRPQWSMGYAVGLASAAGMVGAGTGRTAVHVAVMGTSRGAVELARSTGSPLARTARALDEALMLVDVAQVARRAADLFLEQSRTISRSAAALLAARSAEAAADSRRAAEYFLHDSALQVFLWAAKEDAEVGQLAVWIDRELPRLEGLLEGRPPAAVTDLGRSLTDLVEGFALLGLEARLVVDPDVGDDTRSEVDPAVAMVVVDVVNESLTNVLKHSEDRQPSVEVGGGDGLRCVVRSRHGVDGSTGDGSTSDRPASGRGAGRGAGRGIPAMRARAVAAGGALRTGADGGHFVVELTLPADSGIPPR